MKILKYLLFLLLAILVFFIAIGFVKPKVHYGYEITVDKSIKEAWAVHKDDSKYALWLEGFKSMELISGEHNKVGSKYKIVVNPGEGQPDFTMIETIKSVQEYEHVDLNFDSEMMIFNQRTSFREENGKTKIKTDSTVKGKGLLMRSMFAMMGIFGNSFEKQEAKNIERLKKVIEENTTDYFIKASPAKEELD